MSNITSEQYDIIKIRIEALKKKKHKNHISVGGFSEEKMPKQDLIFEWDGKDISLNKWYSSQHWTIRNKAAKDWHSFFKKMLITPYQKFDAYTLTLEYNSRLDPSNCITMCKLLEDMMQKEKIISNDNKDNCKGIHIIPNLNMKKKSYKITVKHL